MATATGALEWIDGRWHCDGIGIHAGENMEMRFPDDEWVQVRIESGDRGRRLFAHFSFHGERTCILVDETRHALRWPRS